MDLKQRKETLLTHKLQDMFAILRAYPSTRKLKKSILYPKIKDELERILDGSEYGFYNDEPTSAKPKKSYRAVFWNLSGDLNYHCLLDVLKNHPILRKVDFFLFSNADIGMARTQNRNIVRSLALELSCNYVYTCSHLHLGSQGEGPEIANQYGLMGQAIMTPHTLLSFNTVKLPPPVDPLKRENKRIGCEKALVTQIDLPGSPLTLICAKLDSSSSPRQRGRQVRRIFSALTPELKQQPLLFGGGLNTTTYNSRHFVPQFFSFFNKVVRGYDYICEEHHPHPERYFDKYVFEQLKRAGLHYDNLNELGNPTIHCPFEELEVQGRIGKKLSHVMVNSIRRFFYHGPDQLSLKVDWFAANSRIQPSSQLQAERPKVLSNLYHDKDQISSHHPIIVDFEIV